MDVFFPKSSKSGSVWFRMCKMHFAIKLKFTANQFVSLSISKKFWRAKPLKEMKGGIEIWHLYKKYIENTVCLKY